MVFVHFVEVHEQQRRSEVPRCIKNLKKKLVTLKLHLRFNEICLKENLLPIYTNLIYIYIYMYIYIYLNKFILLFFILLG